MRTRTGSDLREKSDGIGREASGWMVLLIAILWAIPAGAQQQMLASESGSRLEARVRPGDQIALEIWREEDMTGEFTVDENGDVVLPRLGVIHASDYTVGEIRSVIRTAYAEFVRTPAIDVTVLRRVGVHGEVREPDLYMIDLTLTLPEVIAKAGGVTAEGNPSKVTIIRDGEQIRLGEREYARLTTAELRSGDQVVVGRRSWLALNSLAAVSTGMVVLSTIISLLR